MQRPLSKDEILKIRTEVFFDFNQPDQLSPLYKAVLQPINCYAPLSAYYQLYDTLKKVIGDGFERDQSMIASSLYGELKRYFLSEECQRDYALNLEDDYLWARVIIVLTMDVFAMSIGEGDSGEIRQVYMHAPGERPSEAILIAIQRLYDLAKTKPAGGAAFHFIANTLLLLPSVVDQYIGEVKYRVLDRYLDLTKRLNRRELNDTTYDVFKRLSPEQDHCLAYLRDKWLARAVPLLMNDSRIPSYNFKYPGTSGKWKVLRWIWRRNRKDVQVAPEQSREKTITVVMIGPSGSGKTTLVRQLVRANDQSIELGVGLQISYGPSHEKNFRILDKASPPSTPQMVMLEGWLSTEKSRGLRTLPVNGQGNEAARVFFRIIDSKGGSMFADPPPLSSDAKSSGLRPNDHSVGQSEGERLYHETAKADLLVLFIPPESLAQSPDAGAIGFDTLNKYFSNFVAQVSQWNKNAMIAIAYTKCDEYGVWLSKTKRIIEEEVACKALDKFRDSEDPQEATWQAFVAAASKRGEGDESPLISDLLTKTALLWKNTVRNSEHPFLNGYLVSAEPVLDYLGNSSFGASQNWELLGLLQIFADFFAHLKATNAI